MKVIETIYLCSKHREANIKDNADRERKPTQDELEHETCSVSGSYQEYPGASSQKWFCDRQVDQVLEVFEWSGVDPFDLACERRHD